MIYKDFIGLCDKISEQPRRHENIGEKLRTLGQIHITQNLNMTSLRIPVPKPFGITKRKEAALVDHINATIPKYA